MALLQWKAGYETGIAAVDHEHRRLIELINDLHVRLVDPDQAASASAFFGDLYAEISAHFALEEKVMRERRYGAYAPHKADHERLLDEIRDLMDEHEEGQHPRCDDDIQARLDTWFLHHFHTMDAPLHAAIGEGSR